jgi:phage-related protein
MAVLDKEISPELGFQNYSGSFDLVFSCMPQQYLKSGERLQVLTGSGTVFNPTMYDAKPLLRIYGQGRLTIGEEQVTITDNDSFIDLDCELEDAFRDTVNLNGCLELSSGDFPILPPGSTSITFGSGITKVELIPRWWCL